MNKFNRKEMKKITFSRIVRSFKYSISGLKSAFVSESNMIVHLLLSIIAISLGFIFKISLIKWCFIVFSIGFVICTELINTAIEATVDLFTDEIVPLAKIVKDTSAGAVLVSAITSLIIAAIIFIPEIFKLI